jgi:hypothetical protein
MSALHDLAAAERWRARGIEVRGSADALDRPRPNDPDPTRAVRLLGNESDAPGARHSRAVDPPRA